VSERGGIDPSAGTRSVATSVPALEVGGGGDAVPVTSMGKKNRTDPWGQLADTVST